MSKKLSEVGDKMQNYGLLTGAAGAVGTAVAPEAGVPEIAVDTGIAMYAFGGCLKDSVSISNAIFGFGNGSGKTLSVVNNMLRNNIPEGTLKTMIESQLDKAESAVGLEKGDNGGC